MPGFDQGSAQRIAQAIRHHERDPHKRPQRGRAPSLQTIVRNALTTSAITARSGTTKGFGTADLYVDDKTGTGNMVLLLANQKIWNVYGSTVATAKWIMVTTVDGLIQLTGADC
jgi:hypothetical protein